MEDEAGARSQALFTVLDLVVDAHRQPRIVRERDGAVVYSWVDPEEAALARLLTAGINCLVSGARARAL